MKLFHAYLHNLLIFLSLTATPPALAKYAKKGCDDKCGNVTIPYPFGLGAECSVNKWYIIDCKNSAPYLPALKDLQILGVDLTNQTVTVSMPRISDCQNPVRNSSQTTSFDLDGSPFLFSRSHNKFVLEGCGSAAMMNNGSVVTGCSSTCSNVTDGDRNNCFGIGCCQTEIPHYVKSYSINLTDMERQGEDGGCGSAFLVDKTLYDEGRLSNPFIVKRNTSFIPVSLLWTLTDSDRVTCCDSDNTDIRTVNMFNGTPVDTLKCASYEPALEKNPYLKDGCKDQATPKYAKTGCNAMCGNIRIPFPFGIGVGCSLNQWYVVDCNSSTPYLHAFNHLQVLDVSLENQTVTVSMPRIAGCQTAIQNSSPTMSIDLGRSPFLFSKLQNKFVFEGCGTATMMDNGNVLTGCSAVCYNATPSSRISDCFGIGCCQTTNPKYLKSYSINFTGLEEKDEGCGSAFLVDQTSYDEGRLTVKNTSFTPVVLLWTLTDSNQVTCCDIKSRRTMDIFNGTTTFTWSCYYSESLEGNPYLIDGCKYSDDEVDHTEECKRCEENGGYCRHERIYDVDGLLFNRKLSCIHDGRRTSLAVILVIKEGTRDELLIAANLALRCLNLNGKYRPTMKEVAIELESIRRSHIPSIIQPNTSSVVYG